MKSSENDLLNFYEGWSSGTILNFFYIFTILFMSTVVR